MCLCSVFNTFHIHFLQEEKGADKGNVPRWDVLQTEKES